MPAPGPASAEDPGAQSGVRGTVPSAPPGMADGTSAQRALADWESKKAKLEAVLVAAEGAECPDAAEAARRRLGELGPAPEVPKPLPSPWASAQRARRATAKAEKLHAAAVAAQLAAASAAALADKALVEADARLAEVAAKLEAARLQETAAFAALRTVPAAT